MNFARKKEFLINAAYYFAVIALAFLVNRFLVYYFFPFAIGMVLAYLLQKPCEKISLKLKIKKGTVAATAVVFCFAAVVLAGVAAILLAKNKLPGLIHHIKSFFEALQGFSARLSDIMPAANKGGKNFYTAVSDIIIDFVGRLSENVLAAAPSLLLSSVITVVASCYIAKDFDAVKGYIFSLISEKKAKILRKAAHIVTENVFKMIKGYILLSFISFCVMLAGFLLLGVNNAAVTAAIIAAVDLLPVLGAGTVLIPWALFELIFGNLGMGVSLAILYLATVVVRNFCEPRIVGKKLGIPPIVMLIIIFVGLKLFGIFGTLLSVFSLVAVVELYKQGVIEL